MSIPSTRSNVQYSRKNLMAEVPSKIYGEGPWIDPLDPRLIDFLRKAKIVDKHIYRGEPITTISFKYYGTTSLDWLIITVNGFLFAEDIPLNYEIKIPAISNKDLNTALSTNKSFKQGQKVRI